MRALRAPDGCQQYFTQPRGGLASFDYDGASGVPPGQTYSVCFKSTPEVCAVALQAVDFDWPLDSAESGANVNRFCS